MRFRYLYLVFVFICLCSCERGTKNTSWLPNNTTRFAQSDNFPFGLEEVNGSLRPLLCIYDSQKISKTLALKIFKKSEKIPIQKSINGIQYSCFVDVLSKNQDFVDFELNISLEKGHMTSSGMALAFDFNNWSTKNFVFVPAAAYNGNRFTSLPKDYPPYLSEEEYHKPDNPVYITDVPRLNINPGPSRLELLTSSATTPMAGIYFPDEEKGLLIYTYDRTKLGMNGIILEESKDRKTASLVFNAPGVRSLTYSAMHLRPSKDQGTDLESGFKLSMPFRIYLFDAKDLKDFYNKFFHTRKSLTGENIFSHVTPYSTALRLQVRHQNNLRWYEKGKYYKNGNGDVPHAHIQLGWVGGLMQPYPLIASGDPTSFERSIQTIKTILSNMQSSTGLFYGIFKDGQHFGDNFKDRELVPEIAMTRKNGDGLYYILKTLLLLDDLKMNDQINEQWPITVKNWADALMQVWNDSGQFGQLLNVKTGKIHIGGSTAGAIIPAAMALAYHYFNDSRYLEVAKQSARYYYNRDISKGYTTGGPGEILSCPDSESAFAMLESFMVLYEITREEEWLIYAKLMAHICSSWVVSYDFKFPENSTLSLAGAKATGAVWASIQNKHAAPGICTNSGESLLKLFRATGDTMYLDLLKDISHNILGFMSTEKRAVGINKDAYVCERVNISDWEGEAGYVGPWANSWVEMAVLLTTTEIPGIYVQPDTRLLYCFDHIDAKIMSSPSNKCQIQIYNPTPYDAEVGILIENSVQTNEPLLWNSFLKHKKVLVPSGDTILYSIPLSHE